MNDRIAIHPTVCNGKPVIKNTRILVANILSELSSGASIEDVIEEYPALTQQDILAALSFGSEMMQFEEISYESVS